MLGIFCYLDNASKDSYKKRIRRQLWLLAGLFAAGLLTIAFALLARYCWKVDAPDDLLGGYLGFGAGLALAGLVLFVKKSVLLRNEARLRKARVEATDERNMQISIRATRAAVAVLLVAMYFAILIGGLWYPVLMTACSMLVCLFVIAYCVAYAVISRRM